MVDTKIFTTTEFNEQYFYDGDDLGSIYSKDKTTFRVWSPLATKVTLLLYDKGYKVYSYTLYRTIIMLLLSQADSTL